jgi:hypothetical protein
VALNTINQPTSSYMQNAYIRSNKITNWLSYPRSDGGRSCYCCFQIFIASNFHIYIYWYSTNLGIFTDTVQILEYLLIQYKSWNIYWYSTNLGIFTDTVQILEYLLIQYKSWNIYWYSTNLGIFIDTVQTLEYLLIQYKPWNIYWYSTNLGIFIDTVQILEYLRQTQTLQLTLHAFI